MCEGEDPDPLGAWRSLVGLPPEGVDLDVLAGWYESCLADLCPLQRLTESCGQRRKPADCQELKVELLLGNPSPYDPLHFYLDPRVAHNRHHE